MYPSTVLFVTVHSHVSIHCSVSVSVHSHVSIHCSVSVSVHSTMDWAQENTLDLTDLNHKICSVGPEQSKILQQITQARLLKEDSKSYGNSSRRIQKDDGQFTFFFQKRNRKKLEAANNLWITARAFLSETKPRGEQNPERHYKLPGHVLFQHAQARCYSCSVRCSKESSGSQRNQTFHSRANSTTASNTDHG